MAEKNTLSILESIKQKMAKFDEKGQKSITAFDSDFDYPASHSDKMQQAENTEMNVESKPGMNLVHDEKEEDDKVNNNDFLFDHEHEDEGKKDFLHEDLEDDFENEEDEEENDVSNKKEESPEIEDIDDEDFILSKEENIVYKPEVKKEEDHGLDLDLGDDEFDMEEEDDDHHQEAQVKQEIKQEEEEEQDDLDIDFDEFDEDEEEQKEVMLDDEEEDDSEFEFEEEKKLKQLEKPEIKIEDKPKAISIEDEDFESIDLDIEDEVPQKSDQALSVKPMNHGQNINIPIHNIPLETNSNSISAIPSRKTLTPSRPLLHEETLQQATGSIKKLMDANNVVQEIKAFTDKNDSSLNELAVQLMESRLERWLNDHLPDLVEKIVREEIKRIIPKE